MPACQFIEQLILLTESNSDKYHTLPNKPCSFTRQRGYAEGIGHNGVNAMTKLLTFHGSVLSC